MGQLRAVPEKLVARLEARLDGNWINPSVEMRREQSQSTGGARASHPPQPPKYAPGVMMALRTDSRA